MSESVSAIVVLRPPGGRSVVGGPPISSENLAEYLPPRDSVERARAHFERRGFEVSEAVAISFQISAEVRKFEDEFGASIDLTEGYPRTRSKSGEFEFQLPLERLPASLREVVETVTFEEPAEFFGGTAG